MRIVLLQIILISFSLYYLFFGPVFGRLLFKRLAKRLDEDPDEKLRYYKKSILFSWLPTAIIAAAVIGGLVTARDVGINWISLKEDTLGKWATYGVLAIFGVLFMLYAYQIIMAGASEAFRNKLASVRLPYEVGMMLPRTRTEKKYWIFISSTAGIIEELVYRGFLLYILQVLFPELHIYLRITMAAVLFGLAHTYQGPAGVAKTGAAGLLFTLVYICTGSLLPCILLHFLMDYAAKDVGTSSGAQAAG